MRPFAEVIGDPIAHSKSPKLHRFWLGALGIDADYRAVQVSSTELRDYLQDRRREPAWRGCNVTAPLKEHAFGLVDELSNRARRVGAINLILSSGGRLIGDNSDLDGVAEAIPRAAVRGKAAILIGAGGASRPALDHLLECGAAKIQILARTPRRAHAIWQQVEARCPITVARLDANPMRNAAVLINASPMGMAQLPMPAKILDLVVGMEADGLVFDMVYEPLQTLLLKGARRTGLSTSDGLIMLIGQAASAFEGFFGKAAPRDLDQALRDHLVAR